MPENSLTKKSSEGQKTDSSKGEFILPADFPLLAPPPIREAPSLNVDNEPGVGPTKNLKDDHSPRGIAIVPKIVSMESAFTLAGLSVPRFESQADYLIHLKNKLERVQKSRPKEERRDKYNINGKCMLIAQMNRAILIRNWCYE